MTLSTFHNYTIFPSHHERFNFYIIEQLIAKFYVGREERVEIIK